MHLKSLPKLMRSELRLDATSVQRSSQRSSRLVRQQGELLRTVSSSHGIGGTSRLPLCNISTNFLRCNNKNNITSLGVKVQRHPVLLRPASPLGCENNTSGSCQTTTDDADAPLNMSTVIKPGHVREKMAIFASEGRRAERSKSSKHTPPSSCDKAAVACTSSAPSTGLSRAVKAKGSWEENGSAKRRRRSGNGQNFPQQQNSHLIEEQQPALKPDSDQQVAEDPCAVMDVTAEEEKKVSVAEMVAIMEQRTSQQRALNHLLTLQRSSTAITSSQTTRPEVVDDEVFEAVRVSEMVAKLESECLRRMDGGLSRNNSLRRTVGRVLLAAGEQNFSPCRPSSPSVTSSRVSLSSSSPSEDLSPRQEPVSSPQSDRVEPPSSAPPTGELVVDHQEVVETPAAVEEQEPLPGLLFLSVPPDRLGSELRTPHYRSSFYLELLPSSAAHCDSVSRSLKRKSKELVSETSCSASVPLGRSASASWDFLKLRRQVQQLLAPQPHLAELPHHLLVKIFLLLPTQSLAALKCTCSSFKFIIETYSVRPADSLWVSDPRYRDDPCKRCRKQYRPGDVSLCRWHHKPYSQALPYGPGNWMCCRGSQRDALGCNVGLHDNRWLPTLHSINMPIYKRNSSHDDRV
uniref:F-box protein 34 n=1 Tax=Nothobranchius pienaari TaxID=704102 RepID=A0A1A8PMV1_9TELE